MAKFTIGRVDDKGENPAVYIDGPNHEDCVEVLGLNLDTAVRRAIKICDALDNIVF